MIYKTVTGLVLSILLLAGIQLQAQDSVATHKPWELKGAGERIEKFRKGERTIIFELPEGTPLSEEVPVQIMLKRLDFH